MWADFNDSAADAFERLKLCLDDVKLWLGSNKLKLNAAKTEFIIFGSKTQLEHFYPSIFWVSPLCLVNMSKI